MTQPHRWGWVDANGTVHVRLPDDEDRVVGQYAAGDAEAALAFYERKFDDLMAEVRLTTGRLQQGMTTPDNADATVLRIGELLQAPSFVGDLGALSRQLDALHAVAAERRLATSAEKTRVRNETLAARQALVDEAQQLATSTQWKATGDRFKELMEQWKALPRFDKRSEEQMWTRFSAGRGTFDKARRAHFAQLDVARAEAVAMKTEILLEADRLSTSTDWAETSRAYRDLMDRWKAAPRAARDVEDRLWKKFRAAQDRFFEARNAQHASRDADQDRNLAAKESLVAKAEALLPIKQTAAARRSLRTILIEWEGIGHVPRDAKPKIEARLAAVEDALGKAERREWQRTDPAMLARAEQTVTGFRASVAKLESDLAAAQAAGNTSKANSLDSSLQVTRTLLEAAERVFTEYRSA